MTFVAAVPDPMDGDADDGATDQRQVQGAGGMTHAAAIFPGADIQPQVEAGFYAPVATVRSEHWVGAQGVRRA